MTRHRLIFCSVGLMAAVFSSCRSTQPEIWPQLHITDAWRAEALAAQQKYRALGYDYRPYLIDSYDVAGDYLNYGVALPTFNGLGAKYDSQGVPMIEYNGTFYYNPTTDSQWGLRQYGRWVRGMQGFDPVQACLNRLMLLQQDNGGMQFQFSFLYYLNNKTYEPPWFSGLAQGFTLSLYARAYLATKDPKYLTLGNQVYSFMMTDETLGGTRTSLADLNPTLSRYLWVDEYPAQPSGYTLNGYMYILLGIHDWSMVSPDSQAGVAFNRGIVTLTRLLPYYDFDYFTCYDLGYITYAPRDPHFPINYHRNVIYLVHALKVITGNEVLAQYEAKWRGYVD